MRNIFLVAFVLLYLIWGVFAQEDETANIRITHLSSDIGEVDIYVNADDDMILQQTYEFADVSSWMDIDSGTYSIVVVPVDGDLEDAILDTDVDLEAGDWVTVAAIGEIQKETALLQVLKEDYSALGGFQSRLSVFHAVPNYEPMNVYVNDVELIRYLGYPGFWGPDSDGFITFDILARVSDIRLEQEDGTVAVDLEDIVLGGNRHYFLAIAGVPSDPEFVFVPTNLEPLEEDEES